MGVARLRLTIENFDAQFRYQWYENNVPIPKENGKTFTTGILCEPVTYRVVASNPADEACATVKQLTVALTTPPGKPVVQGIQRCGPGNVTVKAAGITGSTIRWYNELMVFIGEGESLSISIAANTTLYASAVLNDCEGEKAAVTATVYTQSTAPSVVPVSRCGAGEVTLRATGLTSGAEYVWYEEATGGSPILVGQSLYVISNLEESTTLHVSARMQDTACESDRVAVQANIQPIPEKPQVENGFICNDFGSTVLQITNPIPEYRYEWYSSLPAIPSGKLAVGERLVTGQLFESAVYYVRAVSFGQCSSEFAKAEAIIVGQAPLDIGGDKTICRFAAPFNLQEDFPASSSEVFKEGGVFTGPGVLSGNRFSPGSLAAGSYEITYQNTSLGGCVVTGSRTITVTEGAGSPTITLPESQLQVCDSELPLDLSQFVGAYKGGVFSSSVEALNLSGNILGQTAAGSYEVSYEVEINGCTYRPSLTLDVLANQAAPPTILADQANYCPGEGVILTATTSGDAMSFQWLTSSNELVGSVAQLRLKAGELTEIYCQARDGNGCPSERVVYTFEVPQLPKDIQVSDSVIAQYEAVSFELETSDAISYAWQFEEGATSFQQNPTYFFNEAGVFNVFVAVGTASGCQDTLSTTIQVGAVTTDIVSALKKERKEGYQLYPNPFGTMIYVQTPRMLNKSIYWKVYDATGKVVASNQVLTFLGDTIPIHLRNLSSGIYSITLYEQATGAILTTQKIRRL